MSRFAALADSFSGGSPTATRKRSRWTVALSKHVARPLFCPGEVDEQRDQLPTRQGWDLADAASHGTVRRIMTSMERIAFCCFFRQL